MPTSNGILTARLPQDLLDGIAAVADERHRKRSAIVREALEFYLADHADYQIALDRLRDNTDKILTEQEFLAELGWEI